MPTQKKVNHFRTRQPVTSVGFEAQTIHAQQTLKQNVKQISVQLNSFSGGKKAYRERRMEGCCIRFKDFKDLNNAQKSWFFHWHFLRLSLFLQFKRTRTRIHSRTYHRDRMHGFTSNLYFRLLPPTKQTFQKQTHRPYVTYLIGCAKSENQKRGLAPPYFKPRVRSVLKP